MVFAEIKHHRTPLLKSEYRPSVWPLSNDLVGGISQAQVTVHQAVAGVGEHVAQRDASGFETGDVTYLIQPRSFLIIGMLSEFLKVRDKLHPDKKIVSS